MDDAVYTAEVAALLAGAAWFAYLLYVSSSACGVRIGFRTLVNPFRTFRVVRLARLRDALFEDAYRLCSSCTIKYYLFGEEEYEKCREVCREKYKKYEEVEKELESLIEPKR